jgi:protein-S-isoprenylcysteine O-methyltransferase Ste14
MSDNELVKQAGSYGESKTQVEAMLRLKDSIDKFGRNAIKWNKTLVVVTLVLLVVAIVQLIASIFMSGINPWVGLVIEVIALAFIFYFAFRATKDFLGKKK